MKEPWSKRRLKKRLRGFKYKVPRPLYKEGQRIAGKILSNLNKFQLEGEAFCEKIFKPWFEARRWKLESHTSSVSAKIPFDKCTPEIREALIQVFKRLPDGMIHRGEVHFYIDYKFRCRTPHGIGLERDKFEKYWERLLETGLPTVILFYCADEGVRYTYVLQKPDRYEVVRWGGALYYDVSDDCEPLPWPDPPLEGELPGGFYDNLALHILIQELAKRGIYLVKASQYREDLDFYSIREKVRETLKERGFTDIFPKILIACRKEPVKEEETPKRLADLFQPLFKRPLIVTAYRGAPLSREEAWRRLLKWWRRVSGEES